MRDAAYDAAAASIEGSLARSQQRLMIAIAAIFGSVIAGFGVSALVYLRVGRPLTAMTLNIDSIAHGNLEEPIAGIGRKDEIGGIAAAVGIFRDGLIRNRQLEADAERRRIEAEQHRRDMQTGVDPTVVSPAAKLETRHHSAASLLSVHDPPIVLFVSVTQQGPFYRP